MSAASQRRLEELCVDHERRVGAVATRCGSWNNVYTPKGRMWVRTDLWGFADVLSIGRPGLTAPTPPYLIQVTDETSASSHRAKVARNETARELVEKNLARVVVMIFTKRSGRYALDYEDHLCWDVTWYWSRFTYDSIVTRTWNVGQRAPARPVPVVGARAVRR